MDNLNFDFDDLLINNINNINKTSDFLNEVCSTQPSTRYLFHFFGKRLINSIIFPYFTSIFNVLKLYKLSLSKLNKF